MNDHKETVFSLSSANERMDEMNSLVIWETSIDYSNFMFHKWNIQNVNLKKKMLTLLDTLPFGIAQKCTKSA